MTGPGPDKRKSMMVHESVGVPINHRDASNTSVPVWRKPATPISTPGQGSQRPPRPHENSYSQTRNPTAEGRPRPHDNPYSRIRNDLPSQHRYPGNPNVRQTVLAKPRDGCSFGTDSRARKRPRLDTGVSSALVSNGASLSTRRPISSNGVFGSDIQVIKPPCVTNNRSNPLPNDAEIIDLGTISDDLGERIPRPTKSSSPDPILLGTAVHNSNQRQVHHAFETHPAEYSLSYKGKGRAKELPEFVEASEEDEIQEFTPSPPMSRPFNAKRSPGIPKNIVHERRKVFEDAPVSAPAAIHQPIEKGVKNVDLITGTVMGTVISKMKRKDEGTLGHQRSTGVSDSIGTSSSNFLNSSREKEKIQTLPLEAWCFGQHLIEHSDPAPLKLTYELAQQKIRVTWGRSPPERLEFKLDRDACSAMVIVNDSEVPLKENVVVQFTTTPGSTWKKVERYKGFQGGSGRGRGALTFLISTAKDRGFTPTDYQRFVTGTRKAFQGSVEIINPSKGATIWGFATNLAAMFEQTSRREDRGQSAMDEPSMLTRSVTPCSSTSVKTGSELKASNGDPGPSTFHRRSARQSAIRSLRASPPPPPPVQLDPDEVVLMYPPTGTGALSITHGDLKRLQPEEYLNDTLIEFGLKLWLNDLDPALADQIHVFSSFFYKKLNNRKNPEDGYKSVRKWTSKVDIFTKKYIIVPINENIHWYLAVIYKPGHTLEPPLPLSQSQLSNTRTTRKQKQEKEHAHANSETLTEVSLEGLSSVVHATRGEPEVDTSSADATRATTPSMTISEEMDDVAISVFDKSCSITAAKLMSSEVLVRDSSPNLVHPPSDSMDVDVDTSVTYGVPVPTCEVGEVPEPSTSKPSSGVPASQFYGTVHKPGDMQPVVVEDNEDSGEDQQQEAEVDDMLAVTQSPTSDLPPQTHIFTLDSLGTRHPQAIKVLKEYLKSEAKDKRNFDEVRAAVGKQVQVPVQPNTWDCGIYLLHFVKVFMSAPSQFVEQILSTRGTMPSSDRKKMWQDHEIPQFRDYLESRIIQLSEEWKAEKTLREGEVDRRRSGDALEVEALSSEGEVDIVEDIPRIKATPGPKQTHLATRLRG